MQNLHKITTLYFSMVILSCMAFPSTETKDNLNRHPRNPRVVYDNQYTQEKFKDNKSAETDIMQFEGNFSPKIQERITEVLPGTETQADLRDEYQAFKKNAYNSGDHQYAERNFDFGPSFQANEEQTASFEHGFAGNFETFDAGDFQDAGEFFDIDSSVEKKDPESSAESSAERGPEFIEGDDLSA